MDEVADHTTNYTRPLPMASRQPFVSYAQNGEDVMLDRALRDVECGCYIDIGAAEPEADSVTLAFYRRGWRGVNVEPAPGAFERISAARTGDVNLNVAVGDRDGVAPFYLVDGGNGLSTAVPGQMKKLLAQGWDISEIQVPVRTLASIVEQHVRGTVHFLKIDAEGSERAVLDGASLDTFRPWIILVEATAPNSQMPVHQEWEACLLSAGYRFVWFDGLNRFYVAAEHSGLAMAFQAPPNVFDGFVRHTEAEAQAQLAAARADLADSAAREAQANTALSAALAQLTEVRSDLAGTAERELQANAALETAQAHLSESRSALADSVARTEQVNAALLMAKEELAAQCLRTIESQEEVARASAERDAWMQELFEVNRHAAYLTQVRQNLLDDMQRAVANEQKKDADVEQLHSLIRAMYASTSWKLTRPVRAIRELLDRR